MRTLYLDLSMGAAGDMLAAALLPLVPDPEQVLEVLNGAGIPGLEAALEPSIKCGVAGKHFAARFSGREEGGHPEHGHHGHSLEAVNCSIDRLNLPDAVKKDAREVYLLLADAESKAHGIPVEQIHFHEVGDLDAVTDIVAVCLAFHALSPERFCASAVNVGGGVVHCAHGVLPVPAPATALLLQGIPSYMSDSIHSELCTPTGAALLRYFIKEYGQQPTMKVSAISYGMGKKDFPCMNGLRAVIGESEELITELCCSVDDMTGEQIGAAVNLLWREGALDVSWQSVAMKKNRPGVKLTVLCSNEARERFVHLIFKHTSTIGIRETLCQRFILRRELGVAETPFGTVRWKKSEGYGVTRLKPEMDDLCRIAEQADIPVSELSDILN